MKIDDLADIAKTQHSENCKRFDKIDAKIDGFNDKIHKHDLEIQALPTKEDVCKEIKRKMGIGHKAMSFIGGVVGGILAFVSTKLFGGG